MKKYIDYEHLRETWEESIKSCYHSCPFFRTTMNEMWCGHPKWQGGETGYESYIISQDNSRGRVPDECPLRENPLIIEYRLETDDKENS